MVSEEANTDYTEQEKLISRFTEACDLFLKAKETFDEEYTKITDIDIKKDYHEYINIIRAIEHYITEIKILSDYFIRISDKPFLISVINNIPSIIKGIEDTANNIRSNYEQNKKNNLNEELEFKIMSVGPALFISDLQKLLQMLNFEKKLNFTENALIKIKKTEKAVKRSAGNAAAYDISAHFQQSAKNYNKKNIFWLLIIVILITISLLMSFCFEIAYDWIVYYLNAPICNLNYNFYDFILGQETEFCKTPTHQGEIITYTYISSKIIFFTTLFIFLFFAIKNYNTNKYNKITHAYKADLLKSLEAIFSEYPNDKNDIYLNQLAEYLFTDPVNPFTKTNELNMPYEKVLDLFLKASGKGKD